MALKHAAMSRLGEMAVASGVTALTARRYGGMGSIFMLHSVVPDDALLPRENVHTSVGFLEGMIRYFIAQRIPVLSLSDAISGLASGSTKRFVSFTFDDGYRDNLTLALPIFKKYGVPFTIYVTSAFLERRYHDYWWGQIRYLVMENSTTVGDVLKRPLQMSSGKEKIRAYKKLMGWIHDGTLGPQQLAALFTDHNVTLTDCLDRDAFSATELAVAARREPLLEIGGHTKTHVRLASLDDSAVVDDMRQNKIQLEKIIEREVRHFAYPYGDASSCGEREFSLAKAAGFETAATSRLGNLFPEHLSQRWALPRLRFLGPCESIGFMESQRSGAITALETGFGDPVRSV